MPPKRNTIIPAAPDPTSVGIVPTLNQKIATAAATESASAQRSMLDVCGISNANGNARIGAVSRNTVWMANQTARLSTTPTAAAPMADKAALRALLLRSVSMKGATRKTHAKQGMNVTQVTSKPPKAPATIGESAPG